MTLQDKIARVLLDPELSGCTEMPWGNKHRVFKRPGERSNPYYFVSKTGVIRCGKSVRESWVIDSGKFFEWLMREVQKL